MMKRLILSFFVFSLFSSSLFATGAGITSVNFMKISQGARQSGMGEAFTGIADDVNAIYWNPAGLGQLSRHQACFMHSAWLIDVNIEYLAYALPIKGVGTFGVYGTMLNAGNILIRLEDPSNPDVPLPPTGEEASASDLNLTVAFGKRFADFLGENSPVSDLYAGLSLNITNERIVDDEGGGISANISAFYYPKYENYSLGLTVENAGVSNNRPSLPLAIKAGFGYRFSFEHMMVPFTEESIFSAPENDSAAGIDVIFYPVEQLTRVNVGAEKYWTLNNLHSVGVRAGYKFGYDLGMLAGFTLGLAYRLNSGSDTTFDLDYSMNPYAELGIAHRISLTGKFLGTKESRDFQDKKAAAEFYEKGYKLMYDKDYKAALDEFGKAIKRNRQYTDAYMGVGACFLRLGKKATAYKAYTKALELNPNNIKLKEFMDTYDWGEIKTNNAQPADNTIRTKPISGGEDVR